MPPLDPVPVPRSVLNAQLVKLDYILEQLALVPPVVNPSSATALLNVYGKVYEIRNLVVQALCL